MDFSAMNDDWFVEYATGLVGVYDTLRMTGNKGLPQFESVAQLWAKARTEAERRGLSTELGLA
jgi:hypothetical protein